MKTDTKKTNAADFGKVAVLMGGDSAERQISIQTGTAVFDALCRLGVDAHRFDPRSQPLTELIEARFSRAFIALHGRGGEDGTIQGALQCLGIPYTGSGVLGSALAMDKVRSKKIWKASGLPTPDYLEVLHKSDLDRVAGELGFPVMVKPVNEGSSVGATRVNQGDELEAAWQKAVTEDPRVLVEKWIVGREYTAALLHGQVLPMIQLETPREFYDYEAKYIEDTTRYICPCELAKGLEQSYSALVTSAFNCLGASGWGRIDFMVDSDNQPWLIELNTIPGMTSHSLVPMAARQAGMGFDDLVIEILHTSMDSISDKGQTVQ